MFDLIDPTEFVVVLVVVLWVATAVKYGRGSRATKARKKRSHTPHHGAAEAA